MTKEQILQELEFCIEGYSDFRDGKIDEVSIDEVIGLGIDCEHCGIHISFNEECEEE